LKVAHVAIVTPGRCGLYETTRELVAGLRTKGVDSRIVDPTPDTNQLGKGLISDRSAIIADFDWASTADVVVSHSGFVGTPMEHTEQPVVHVAHGRPHSTFIGEVAGGTPVYSYHYGLDSNPRIKAVVTFWKQHVDFHKMMMPSKRVVHVPSSVDLHAWTPVGPKGYKFGGNRATVNVVCTDAWRDDVDHFAAFTAFALWARKMAGTKLADVKLHIYGAPDNLGARPGWGSVLKRIQDEGHLGEIKGWVSGLDHVYRAADFTLTPNTIDVRTVRESMACGCPVVRVPGTHIDNFDKDCMRALLRSRSTVRKEAESRFHPDETARQFKSLLETL
jgi:glycosyltransferase involved in cell wall biosynthesis